jgi:hypothetical protein
MNNLLPGHWGIWRDNVGRRFLVADHKPPENCWKFDADKRYGFGLWEVAWDVARRKAVLAEYRLFVRSNRIDSLNYECEMVSSVLSTKKKRSAPTGEGRKR